MYDRSIGAEFTLDPLPNDGLDTFLLFPIVPIRLNKVMVNNDTASLLYRDVRRQLKIIGIDVDLMISSLEENNPTDLAKVEDAFIMHAVNIYATEQSSLKVLWRMFKYMHDTQLTNSADFNGWVPETNPPPNIFRITETNFNTAIQHNYITYGTIAGVIGPIGTYTSSVTILANSAVATISDTNDENATAYGNIPQSKFILRQQVAGSLYLEMTVHGLFITTSIPTTPGEAKVRSVFLESPGHADRKLFNIPIGLNQLDNLPMSEREEVIYSSLIMQIYAKDTIELAYYETAAFANFIGNLMLVITVVLTVVSFGGSTPFSTAMLEFGKRLLIQYALTLALKEILSHNISGASRAVAIALYTAASVYNMKGGNFDGLLSAESLMLATNGVTQGMLIDQSILADRLNQDIEEFSIAAKEAQEELQEKFEELNNYDLDPFGITSVLLQDFSESPDEFYKRTTGTKNPGVLTKDAISMYYKNKLTLPGR